MNELQKTGNNQIMRKISEFFQEILKILLLFLFYYVWIRYFVRKLVLSLVISIFLALATYLVLHFFKRKKINKSGLKQKEKEDAENMFLSLACSDEPMKFFENLAKSKHQNVKTTKKYLTITYPEENVKTFLYFCDDFSGLDTAKTMQIIKLAKKEKPTKVVILCKFVSDKNLQNFLSNFNVKFLILDEYETYEKLYKTYEIFPKITHKYNSEKKMMVKDFVAYSFNKKRTKGYLFSAFVLVISSLFVRMTIYYCIIATILIIFALISQFNPYFNTKSVGQIL